jgi:phosphoribosylformylglycinamidine synthase
MPPCTALIIRAPGTNCDVELARAFQLAGATPSVVHLDALIADPDPLERAAIVALPGGFSYGDDVASGRVFAARLRHHLYPQLRAAAARGSPIFCVCNGFQIAVQAGVLPGPEVGQHWPEEPAQQELSLAHNTGGRFIDNWFPVRVEPSTVCVWTQGLAEAFAGRPEALMLPIAHGEGRIVAKDRSVLDRLSNAGQIPLRYGHAPHSPPAASASAQPPLHPDNPNGSTDDIVGVCDPTGRVFGLMPHPERFLDWNRHPYWTRLSGAQRAGDTPGLLMFRNAVAAAQAALT